MQLNSSASLEVRPNFLEHSLVCKRRSKAAHPTDPLERTTFDNTLSKEAFLITVFVYSVPLLCTPVSYRSPLSGKVGYWLVSLRWRRGAPGRILARAASGWVGPGVEDSPGGPVGGMRRVGAHSVWYRA